MIKMAMILSVSVLLLACQNTVNKVSAHHQYHTDRHQSQAIYYFEQSGFVGVKTDDGKVIIEPNYSNIKAYDYQFAISTPYIELWGEGILDNFMENYPKNTLSYPAGVVFDRQGNFLYRPLAFDNGSDYWQEGVRRYVNDKAEVGFVDELGNIIISAKYQYVSPFNYGYAQVYVGDWQRHYADSGDYLGIKPANDNASTYLINQHGQKVNGYNKAKHPKDLYFEGKYYPYPFSYTAFEQKLLDKLAHLDKDSHLEITQKPNIHFPYYRINRYDKHSFLMDKAVSYLVAFNGQVLKEQYFSEVTPIAQFDFYADE